MERCLLATLLLLSPGARAEDPPSSGAQGIRSLVQAVRTGAGPERVRELAGDLVQATSPSGGLAATLRDPAISANVGFSASVEGRGISFGGGFEPGKGKLFLKTAISSVEVSGDPENRTVGITFTVGHSASWAGGQKIVSLDLTYPDNRTFLAATGFDGRSLPGTSTVLEAMDRILQRAAPEGGGATPDSAARAARDALVDDLVPEMFRKGTEFATFTYGEGEKISIPASNGSIAVSEMRKTRMRVDGGPPVEFTEQSAEVAVPLKGLVAEAEASVSLAVSSDPEAQKNAHQLALARRLEAARGDPAEALRAFARERLLPIYEASRIADGLAMIRDRAAAPIDEVTRLFVIEDPDVGGVKVHFNPDLLRAAHPPGQAAELLRLLGERGSAGGSAVIRLEAEQFDVKLVSLADAMRTGRLGLSRVRGFVAREDDFLLVGDAAEPGMPAEWLTTLLRTIWQRGHFPAISLDPDPVDFAGAQTARVYGVPADLVDSDAVRLMLEADYAMKRIELGEDDPGVPGLRTAIDLAREAQGPAEFTSRMWLTPSDPWVGDVLKASSERSQCVWFRSEIKVRSERMERVFGQLRGAGEVDPLADAAAASFTSRYAEVAAARPVFADLAGFFDLAKLCAILRAHHATHPALDAMAERTVPRVHVPASWKGIGPKRVEGTNCFLSGGATTRTRPIDPRPWTSTGLEPLLEGPAGAKVTIQGAPVTGFQGDLGNVVSAEILANGALHALAVMDPDLAFERAETALAADPTHPICRMAHALAAAATGRMEAAIKDAEALIPEDPRFRAFAALLLACNGDEARALGYADAADRELGDDPTALCWSGRARLLACDFAGAEAAAGRLAALLPEDPLAYDLRSELDVAWALGRAAARDRIEEIRALPGDVAEAFAGAVAQMKRLQFEAARLQFAAVRGRAEARGISAHHIIERCLMGIALASRAEAGMLEELRRHGVEDARASGIAAARELADRHPDWPSAWLLVSWFDRDPWMIAKFEAAAANDPEDALLPEIRAILGADRVVAYALLTHWWQMPDKREPLALEALESVAASLGDGPEARLLHALGEADRLDDRLAVRVLKDALAAWPADGPRDVVATSILTFVARRILHQHVVVKRGGLADLRGEDAGAAVADACMVLRLTEGDAPSWEMLSILSAVRTMAAITLALADLELAESDPRLRLLRREAANGKYDPAEADRVFSAVIAERRAAIEFSAGPFAAALVDALRPTARIRADLIRQAAAPLAGLEESGASAERLRALEEELDRSGGRVPFDARGFARAAESARTPVDARVIGLLGDISDQYLPPELGDAGIELRRMIAAARARLQPYAPPPRAPRDWRAWEGR